MIVVAQDAEIDESFIVDVGKDTRQKINKKEPDCTVNRDSLPRWFPKIEVHCTQNAAILNLRSAVPDANRLEAWGLELRVVGVSRPGLASLVT